MCQSEFSNWCGVGNENGICFNRYAFDSAQVIKCGSKFGRLLQFYDFKFNANRPGPINYMLPQEGSCRIVAVH